MPTRNAPARASNVRSTGTYRSRTRRSRRSRRSPHDHTAGWITHAFEQCTDGALIPPRARYVGNDAGA
ncbi:hypothetical protein CFB45_14370 [Burkholderia sp. HI2500]|nr:hypothetical protein CFB45_14370 [Burkholderia sp. HI2500]